jgi:ketosteroid isomerase-like protein
MRTLQETERTRDVEPLVALFAEDAELANLHEPGPLRGKDGARRFWQDYLGSFERIGSVFDHVLEGPDGAALEWVSDGALPEGRACSYRGVSLLEWEDGLVRRFRAYYDSAALRPAGAEGPGRDQGR